MMKLFETPELEVVKFVVNDMITTSIEEEDGPPTAPGLDNCLG